MKSKEEQALTEDGVMLNASIEWWKAQANNCMGRLQLLENKFAAGTASPEDYDMYDEILEETNTLIAKGRVEENELAVFEKKAEEFALKKYKIDEDLLKRLDDLNADDAEGRGF